MPTSPISVIEDKIITTDDHTSIYATCFQPEIPAAEVLLIASEIGVNQSYYRAFARFLASKGYLVYTFNYRSLGRLAYTPIQQVQEPLQTWGIYDLKAMLKHIRLNHPYTKLSFIGHGISGQLLSLTSESRYLAKVILVAAPDINRQLWPFHSRYVYAFMVNMLAPAISQLAEFFTGNAFRLASSLPKGVARDLASWSSHKGTFAFHSYEPLQQIDGPLLAISFSDDLLTPYQAVKALARKYSQAARTYWQVKPSELSLGRVGHYGFFKAKMKHRLWEPMLEWLEQTERFDKPLLSTLMANQTECMEAEA